MTKIPEFLEESLNFNIYRTSLLLRREFLRVLSADGITPEQWQVLAILEYAQHPVNQGDIAKLSLKDKHTVSRIIARMEKNGWVSKKSDARDGRITVIALTPAGQSLAARIPKLLNNRFSDIGSTVSEDEKQLVIAILRKLRTYLGDA